MPAPTVTTRTNGQISLVRPRWGFFKGLLTGLVIEVPVIAAAVWALAQLGFGNPEVGYMELLRFTTVFAGVAAAFTAGGIGRLAAFASIEKGGGRKRAAFVAARAHAMAGVGLVVIAAIPHGHLPEVRWHWLALAGGGLVAGAVCGAIIGLVCGGAAPVMGVVALAKRPTEVLRALLDPEEIVKLGVAVRNRSSRIFEGMFDPAPRPPEAKPVEEGKPEPKP